MNSGLISRMDLPEVIDNFISKEDAERVIEIINREEISGNLRRNEHFSFGEDGRLFFWNSDDKEFWQILKKYLKQIASLYEWDIHPHDVAMLKYYPGPGMSVHSDQSGPCKDNCSVTSVIYLNDEYEGGDVEFPALNKSYKLDARSVMHFTQMGDQWNHLVKDIKSGNRYAIITCYTENPSMLRDVHKDFRD